MDHLNGEGNSTKTYLLKLKRYSEQKKHIFKVQDIFLFF